MVAGSLAEKTELVAFPAEIVTDFKGRFSGFNYPHVLSDFANVLIDQGRVEEAVPLYERAVALIEQRSGGSDPNLPSILRLPGGNPSGRGAV
jgi:hypothetical protein